MTAKTGFGGGVGGGGDARRSRRLFLVLFGDGSGSKKLLPPKTVSWEHLFRTVATQHISWEVLLTYLNGIPNEPQVSKTLHGSSFSLFAMNDAHN